MSIPMGHNLSLEYTHSRQGLVPPALGLITYVSSRYLYFPVTVSVSRVAFTKSWIAVCGSNWGGQTATQTSVDTRSMTCSWCSWRRHQSSCVFALDCSSFACHMLRKVHFHYSFFWFIFYLGTASPKIRCSTY